MCATMNNRIIKLSYPITSSNQLHTYKDKISFVGSLYGFIDFFEKEIFPEIKLVPGRVNENIILRSVINLHNKEGIKDINQIKRMINVIHKEKQILHPSTLPNIKLAKIEEHFILFDGHHSLLAYMSAGRNYLCEIPHLLLEGITNEETKVFFGQHKGNWKTHVINWQAPQEQQLCVRREKNMGELFSALADDICPHIG